MIGSTISHYQILERLGGGGMGVVYKARDVRLDRLVALKFLASHRGASEEDRRRFLREARTASQLDHPNICTIHEIDETEDGALFIAMALYPGETLRDRIDRGPLPVAEAADIAGQIAAGLAAAHARGIVHRDVKPANVVLTTEGQVKLLDFGIARLADQSRLTRAGAAMGTVAYMSPEQLRGSALDARTDVWSLGVVLYQMVTGRLPFEGPADMEMARGILERSPRPLSSLRSGVPARLERIAARALAKPPEDRYATMEEMRADLRGFAETARTPEDEDRTLLEIPLSAVLPSGARAREEGRGLVGATVGPYRILELLGGGGMGVIYKAEDIRLSRTVALKFLPPELTRDPQAKERFMQEARAASAQDHPNLCTVLEAGETPDGQLYLAMPCYDGETLRKKIERGPLPIDEAIDIAQQIARGLAKAHRHGVVHRDLKPANLIVTSDGVVKILDFGLATLAGAAAVSSTGSSAGTPAYMSPEQARGGEVDFRTDLWSLGVVLYEMLAGRRPFRGGNEQAVIYALLNERPQPLRELRPEVPPELERIVDRLLARDPADRYPTVEGALAELRALHGETATRTLGVAGPRRAVRPWLWAALAVAMIAGVAGYLLRDRSAPAAAPVQATFTRLTDQEGRELYPSLSPDGDFFVYARHSPRGDLDIYLQRIGGGNPIDLTPDSPFDDTQPAFSPDGKQIAFRSERDGGGLFVMGATGESVRRLTDFGYNPAWSPDGTEILAATQSVRDPRMRHRESQIWRIPLSSGRRRPVVQGDAVQPGWSPHGQRIAYWTVPTGSSRRVIWTVSADGGGAVQVTNDGYLNWNPLWSADGRHLYFASDRGGSMNLWRVPIDEDTGRVRGEPEPITTPSQWSGLLAIGGEGRRILYTTWDARSNVERVAIDPAGPTVAGPLTPVTQGSREVRYSRVSPDGRWIVFSAASPQEDLFIVGTDGNGLRQLTNDAARDRNPGWSPDGQKLLFYSDRGGRYEAWTVRPDGSGLQQVTETRGEPVFFPLWSPDGHRLVCGLGFTGPAIFDLARPAGRSSPERLPPTPGGVPFFASSWSRDGKRLAGFVQNHGIHVFSFETRRYERLTDRGQLPIWLHDGWTLVYMDEGKIFALDTRTRRSRELLSPAPGSTFIGLDVAPDGRALYLVRSADQGDIWMLTLP